MVTGTWTEGQGSLAYPPSLETRRGHPNKRFGWRVAPRHGRLKDLRSWLLPWQPQQRPQQRALRELRWWVQQRVPEEKRQFEQLQLCGGYVQQAETLLPWEPPREDEGSLTIKGDEKRTVAGATSSMTGAGCSTTGASVVGAGSAAGVSTAITSSAGTAAVVSVVDMIARHANVS